MTKWNSIYQNSRDFQWLTTTNLQTLCSIAPHAKKALDIGCGTGQVARDLWHRGLDVVGVDTSETAIQIAQKSVVRKNDGLTFLHQDIITTPLDTTFDLIVSKYVMTFVTDADAWLRAIQKLMKSTSVCVIILPDINKLPEQKKSITLEKNTAITLLEKYFSVEVREVKDDYWYVLSLQARI